MGKWRFDRFIYGYFAPFTLLAVVWFVCSTKCEFTLRWKCYLWNYDMSISINSPQKIWTENNYTTQISFGGAFNGNRIFFFFAFSFSSRPCKSQIKHSSSFDHTLYCICYWSDTFGHDVNLMSTNSSLISNQLNVSIQTWHKSVD